MGDAEIYRFLTGTFKDIFAREDIVLKPEMAAGDIAGWDSFKQIEIIMAVEDFFRIKASTKELDQLQNVADLVNLIKTKTGKVSG